MAILIIDNYDSFTFNLYQMLQESTSEKVEVHRNDAITLDGIRTLRPTKIVLSPGPGHPSRASDFGVCKDVITEAAELQIPTLGICLGHQGMAQHLGGTVERAPEIVHGKISTITITKPSAIFDGVSQQFDAMRYHSLIARDGDLPDCLEVTARDNKTNLIMAMQHKKLPMFGLQFHPESIGTPEGRKMLENFARL